MTIVKHLRQDAARLVGVGVAVSLSACSTLGVPQTGALAQRDAKVSAPLLSPSISASAAPASAVEVTPEPTVELAPAPSAELATAELTQNLPDELSTVVPALSNDAAISFGSPLPGYSVNSRFGLRQMSYEPRARMHDGVDIAAPIGSPVRAAADGHVSRTGLSSSYGRFVEVAHADGLTSFYAHMSRTAGLEPGAKVAAGEVLGYVGSTGHSTGPHLHFEIRDDGKPLNPQDFIGRVFASAADLPLVEAQATAEISARATAAVTRFRQRMLASWHVHGRALAAWHGRGRQGGSYTIDHRTHARFAAG